MRWSSMLTFLHVWGVPHDQNAPAPVMGPRDDRNICAGLDEPWSLPAFILISLLAPPALLLRCHPDAVGRVV
jgi:hypothetical protein